MNNPKGAIFASLAGAKLTRAERLSVCAFITCREVKSTNDLTSAELECVAGTLFSWVAAGHLDERLAGILGRRAA